MQNGVTLAETSPPVTSLAISTQIAAVGAGNSGPGTDAEQCEPQMTIGIPRIPSRPLWAQAVSLVVHGRQGRRAEYSNGWLAQRTSLRS